MTAKGRSAGVLPISAAATKKDKSSSSQPKASPRTPAPRVRLIIRRLAPGLTEVEFWEALGEEWKVGKGKVEWAVFKDGKISKDPAKPSRPARAYLKVKDQSLLDELSNKVRQTSFQDAKNTVRDACLIGPPSLEFAPFNKLAGGRSRNDGRQGTIDQDQEFIDFLQSLTEPINKSALNGTEGDGALGKITTTPLVQYLKEKKANKAKEAAEKKNAKARQQDGKETKQPKTEKIIAKSATSSPEKAKVVKASQEAVKAVTKSVAQIQAKASAASAKGEAKPPTPAKDGASTTPSTARKERQAISAAARIQRDLGLAPKAPRAARTPSTVAPNTAVSTSTTVSSKAESQKQAEKQKGPPGEEKKAVANKAAPVSAAVTPPTGPRAARNNAPASVPATTASANMPPAAPKSVQARPKAVPQPSSGAKSAFLKHANPSQGVTEDLLRTVFTAFGPVTRCEIDKKKGLAYVDFEDIEALKKAMAASPVKIGDKGGQVVVLENRNVPKSTKPALAKQPVNSPAPATTVNAAKSATPITSPKPVAAAPVNTAPTVKATTQPPATTAAATLNPNTKSSDNPNKDTTEASKATTQALAPAPPTAPRNASKNAGRGGRAVSAQGGRGGGGGGRGGRNKGGGRGRGGTNAVSGSPATPPTTTSAAPDAPKAAAAPKADVSTMNGGNPGGEAAQ